ncbi:MAG TPA: MlaD family protein [Myxococcota bacterium]|jgi:paraquat-inducible protein B
MTEQGPERGGLGGIADAVVETRERPSIVWLIPLIAVLVGAFVAYRAISDRGPEITISFKTAGGLEAGKTKLKYKDVEIGVVESVELAPDLDSVVCRARMVKGSEDYLRDKSQFWVVEPRIAGGQVSGLTTLLSGAYIGVDPVRDGKRARSFVGLEAPPIVTTEEAGRFFVLRSTGAGAISVGSPVFFRRIEVGQVVTSALDPTDDFVTTRIFVRSPFDQRVHAGSRFWNASGIDVTVSASGVKIDTESLVSILIGGIAFDAPEHGSQVVAAAPDTVFPLYETREASEELHYSRSVAYLLYFDQSVRGLAVGAPVEFRGINVGRVTDVALELDPTRDEFRIPVMIEIHPDQFTNIQDENKRREILDKLVASGMRAQLKSGNLLTGQLIVELDIFENAKPAQIAWNEPIPVFPTIPTPLEEITANIAHLVERLSRFPVDQIGNELNASLKELRGTLAEAERTLASANAMLGPDSDVREELTRALLELGDAARSLGLAADQIESEPNSLIFGKKGSK